MQCSGMHFGTNAHQGCQHEGQDEPNLTLKLNLAFLVQSKFDTQSELGLSGAELSCSA